MRKILSFMVVVLLCFGMVTPALAAKDSFVPSIGYKDGPDIVDAEMDEEDVVDCLVVTSIEEAEEKTTDIEKWNYATLNALYQEGKHVPDIEKDYRWKQLTQKLTPLFERNGG